MYHHYFYIFLFQRSHYSGGLNNGDDTQIARRDTDYEQIESYQDHTDDQTNKWEDVGSSSTFDKSSSKYQFFMRYIFPFLFAIYAFLFRK